MAALIEDGRTFAFDEEFEPWRDADGTVVGVTGRVTPAQEWETGGGT